ncbi:cell cycle checkpoint protein RAD17 isoform X7 [Malania oleifera]|uniref:cell cycle checkpoint protein RAD17 isoform X7 n=1 Tax=Malania oleifera TaxID=397392 RepID=UPI0025AEA202|nr:cell cycle checkpoint protein RAD17 isoform X7 [Malania oleifera]
MGRRTTIVISSSDEEDKGRSSHSSHSRSNSKSRPSMARTNPRGPKKARLSCPRSSSCKESSAVDEFKLFYEDFEEGFTGFKVSAADRMCKHESGLGSSNQKELWIDKYQPHSLDELAVHKKKVEEVKAWFEGRLRAAKEEFHSHVLVITGQAGVGKSVAFNPITVNSIKKTLSRICRQELCNVNAEVIDLIAKSSGGDIRHAITSLQYYCLKPHPMLSLSFSNHTPRSMKEKSDELNHLDGEFSLSCGRDDTVSLFHALGKFLHNKRETEVSIILDQDAFLVRERFTRLPLKMDAPEKVLCQAHVQARPVADFLHENVLDFLSEEAIDDAWDVASYLSDSDLLLATLRGMITRNFDAESLVQTAAASVAVRGVLFGNSHPLPSRWHAIRRPKLWQVEQSSSGNKYEILRQRFASCNGLGSADATVIATEYTPALKWLGYRASEDSVAQDEETEDDIDRMSLENREGKISDDEIEDW